MVALDFESSTGPKELDDCEDCPRASANRRRDRSADDAELRERSESEDQTRSEKDIDPVGKPQRAHCDRSVARATKDRVDHEKHHDAEVASEHYSRKRGAMFDHPWRAAHERKEFRSERGADCANDNRHYESERNRLDCRACSAIGVLFTDATRDHRHRADAQTDRKRVNKSHQGLGETDSCSGVCSEM